MKIEWLVWAWVASVWCVVGRGDEEDPHQHAAQINARENKLNDILKKIEAAESLVNSLDSSQANNSTITGCRHDELDITIPSQQLRKFVEGTRSGLQIANLLNNFYLGSTSDSDFSSATSSYPPRIFYSQVRTAVEAETSIVSAGIAFLRGEFQSNSEKSDSNFQDTPNYNKFAAYGYRRNGAIYTADLSQLYNYSYDHSDQPGTKWFTHLTHRLVK